MVRHLVVVLHLHLVVRMEPPGMVREEVSCLHQEEWPQYKWEEVIPVRMVAWQECLAWGAAV